jgi:hypothetical protein
MQSLYLTIPQREIEIAHSSQDAPLDGGFVYHLARHAPPPSRSVFINFCAPRYGLPRSRRVRGTLIESTPALCSIYSAPLFLQMVESFECQYEPAGRTLPEEIPDHEPFVPAIARLPDLRALDLGYPIHEDWFRHF